MSVAAAFLIASLLLGAYGGEHSEKSPPPTTVPFTNAFGLIVVKVRVNDRGPYDFMLDTGSQTTVISPKLAATLGLPAIARISRSGAGASEIPSIRTTLASISVGRLTRHNAGAVEMPLPESLAHRLPGVVIQGYVGCDFFEDSALTIDYASARLIVSKAYAPDPDAIALPMHLALNGSVPAVEARFDDVAGTFLVDSGNSGWPTLDRSFFERAKIGARYSTGAPSASEAAGNQSVASTELCLERFSLGSTFHMSHVPAYADSADTGVSAWPDQDGTIGYEIMRRVRTTLDFANRVVYFERTKPVESADYATTGDCVPSYGFGLGGG